MEQGVSFGNYRFDVATGRLWSGAQEIRLTPKASAVLKELVMQAERILGLNPLDVRALSLGSGRSCTMVREPPAFEWSARSLELFPDDMGALIQAACLHAKARRKEEALALLERVFGRGWGKRDWVEHDPDDDILRDDPRFQKLTARLK